MTVPTLAPTRLESRPQRPLLVVGPSLGTTTALWEPVAATLDVEVLGFDLPGHGDSPPATEAFTVSELATAVLALAEQHRGKGAVFHYAGDSLGGGVGLALALQAPEQVLSLAAVCTGATIGDPAAWRERAAVVRTGGTSAVVDSSRQRWFAPGFTDREPVLTEALLDQLRGVDAESYALTCETLAAYDLRKDLPRITVTTVVVSGSDDVATPPDVGAQIADGVPGARQLVLDGVGHLAPVEAPDQVVAVLRELTQQTSQQQTSQE